MRLPDEGRQEAGIGKPPDASGSPEATPNETRAGTPSPSPGARPGTPPSPEPQTQARRTASTLAIVTDVEDLPAVLSIAGSDSGGGAGIQADLKAFAACGVHGMTAITAITAQNTVGVDAIASVAPEMIVAQVASVVRDIGVDAVKIGMLGTVETIAAVGRALDLLAPGTPIVLDPVMVSESGSRLLEPEAQEALIGRLIPRATFVTPNVPEARVIAGLPEADAPELARAIHALGPRFALVTGGHREVATDVLFDGEELIEISGQRYRDGAAHGSGCTHSSALAAHLAWGFSPADAARSAKAIASRAVRDGLREIGRGPGPVDALGIRALRPRVVKADGPGEAHAPREGS